MKTKAITKFIIITLPFCLTACDIFKSEPEPTFHPPVEFLKTYRQIKETEKLENKITEFQTGSLGSKDDLANHCNINETIKQYKLIEQKLLNIRRKDPHWNPWIIDYRLKKTSESIRRLEKKYSDIAHKRYTEYLATQANRPQIVE